MTLPSLGMTRSTLPSFPLSLPWRTITGSPFLSFISEHLRGERDDPHEPAVAQLPPNRAEDAGAAGGLVVLDQDGRVVVESDIAAIGTTLLLLGPHDDALHDVAFLDRGARNRILDRRYEDVADRRVAPAGTAEHFDDEDLLGAAVVGDPESGLLLDHRRLTSPSRGPRRPASASASRWDGSP